MVERCKATCSRLRVCWQKCGMACSVEDVKAAVVDL